MDDASFIELEESTDPPTDDEVREYAMYLGASLPEDDDLLEIARECLTAKLPPPC